MTMSRALLLLVLAAFLAPIIGGHLGLETGALAPGLGSLIESILRGTEAATLAHGLIALLLLGAVWVLTGKRQVIQLPVPRIAIVFILFVGLLLMSVAESQYKTISLTTWAEWTMAIVSFFAVVAGSGRKAGPRLITGALFVSCLVVALYGIWEYITQSDPNWRIFSLWHHPNALAGMLLLGIFCGLGLGMTGDRRTRWWSFAGVAITICALGLTASKGGYLAAAVGVLFLVVLCFGYAGSFSGSRRAAYVVGVFVAAGVIMLGAQKLQHQGPTPLAPNSTVVGAPASASLEAAPLSRIMNAGGSQDQSIGFRVNLWKGCFQLIKANPLGWGIGTYSFESARPGLTTETQLAHDSYLQLAVEANLAAAILLVAGLGLCLFECFKGSRKLPLDQNLLRAGIMAALLASCVHNVFDSDWYMFGNSVAFFMLLGVALQLSSDAVIPEFIPRFGRAIGASVAAVAGLLLLYSGVVSVRLASETAGSRDFKSLQGLAPWDHRVWYYSAIQTQSAEEATQDLRKAIDYGPTEAEYRRLSDIQAQNGEVTNARSTLQEALKMDPNNLVTLYRLLLLDSTSNPDAAAKTAQKLVDLEKTSYFTTRALAELVPTETYRARLFLANRIRDPKAQAEMLRPAIEGLLNYARSTVPQIIKMRDAGGPGVYGNPAEAKKTLMQALEAVKAIQTDYTLIKDAAGRAWAAGAQGELEAALGNIDSSSK